jgi:hypothetical protein
MLTCKSPRKVMREAYHLACQSLPSYSCKFSRKDFTLPQLFACLAVKEMLNRSYRGAERLLADCDNWLRDVGLRKAPDHNTLCRASALLLGKLRHVNRLLDAAARWAATRRILGLSRKPLALDSSAYEPRHVSRYFEFRRGRGGGDAGRRRKVRAMPRLGLGVAAACHLILSMWAGTGGGADYRLFEPLVFDAWRRVPNRSFAAVADKGFDDEKNHGLARQDMGLRSLIPPRVAWKTGRPPTTRWRRHMTRRDLLGSKRGRRRCGYTQRWQVECVNSMTKRNQGSALRGRTPASRLRDLRLKVLTHNVMVLRPRVETEHDCP